MVKVDSEPVCCECGCLVGTRSCYLLISHVVGAGGGRLLHGDQGEHLEQVVLHDVAAERGEVLLATPLSANSLPGHYPSATTVKVLN